MASSTNSTHARDGEPAAVKLTWRRAPAAARTLAAASLHALRRQRRGQVIIGIYALAAAVCAVAVIVSWSGLTLAARLLPVDVVIVGAGCVAIASVGMVVTAKLLPWGTCWVSPATDIVLTVWRWRGSIVHAGNFAAYPQGDEKTGPFLTALCADADSEGLTIRARAGDRRLFTQIYCHYGFVIVGDQSGRRPKIERLPAGAAGR